MNEKVYLGVDVGGSLNKIFSIARGEEKFDELNNYVLEHDNYVSSLDYVTEGSGFRDQLDLSIKLENTPSGEYRVDALKITETINSRRWIMGALAKAMSANATKLPIGTKVKHHHYYLNAISSAVVILAERGIHEAELDLGLLLPAKQYFQKDKAIINEVLKGTITVTNNLTHEKFVIKITGDVLVKPEAVVSITSCFIDNGQPTDIYREFGKKFNLIMDIGENTWDLAGLRDGKPDPLSFDSFGYAGSLLASYVRRELFKILGYEATDYEVIQAISTGFVDQGAAKEWVGQAVSDANGMLAEKAFMDFTQKYLPEKGYNIQQIAAFVFVGGGSIKVDKITSVGDHFMRLVKETSKHAATYSPTFIRYANIRGLADSIRKQYSAQVA